MNHITDELLVDLALGEPADPTWAGHLGECPECRDRLESLRRTVDATVGSAGVELVAPPPTVWAGVEAELDRTGTELDVPEAEPARPEADTPTDVRSGEPTPAPTPIGAGRSRRRERPATGWLAAAAVAGIVVGSGVTALVTGRDEGPAPSPTVATVAAAQLDTLDTGRDLGTAQVVRSPSAVSLSISTHDLTPEGGYLEVWLINEDGKRMVSVGVLPGGGTRVFPISQALIDRGYTIVDISREAYDDDPAHSGVSLVRGTLHA